MSLSYYIAEYITHSTVEQFATTTYTTRYYSSSNSNPRRNRDGISHADRDREDIETRKRRRQTPAPHSPSAKRHAAYSVAYPYNALPVLAHGEVRGEDAGYGLTTYPRGTQMSIHLRRTRTLTYGTLHAFMFLKHRWGDNTHTPPSSHSLPSLPVQSPAFGPTRSIHTGSSLSARTLD